MEEERKDALEMGKEEKEENKEGAEEKGRRAVTTINLNCVSGKSHMLQRWDESEPL